jgi:hypothetical protein
MTNKAVVNVKLPIELILLPKILVDFHCRVVQSNHN